MLVLTRREGESVVVGTPNNLIGEVRVLRCSDGSVKLGFEFISGVEVNRREVVRARRPESGVRGPGSVVRVR